VDESEWNNQEEEIVISPVQEEYDRVVEELLADTYAEVKESLRIEPSIVKSLTSSDSFVREQSEQFICVVCKDFPIPDFEMVRGKIDVDSIRLCQCEFCNGLSCFSCWKKLSLKKDPICPKCKFRIELPKDIHLDMMRESKIE